MRELASPWRQTRQGSIVTLSLTEKAQETLGPVYFWDLPEIGAQVCADQPIIVVMSQMRYTDLTVPLNGMVVEVNPGVIGWTSLPSGTWVLKIDCH
ncbi:MAG: glycine cleavage system protein H [Limosilactobacillus gorillae]|jgi:glycine cleavage system H lipoate-binding protein|uniref:glycine cleavage system protein H n=1 Tax=Limosilactobacillus gorillae TaxID=1450649 RepID=UPI000AFAC879|nr:glycine cleavage system protein H [Limosilactobacillus gorillae]MDO4854970.1 glycine cleavage system protein H [Limosilactobacillus gorillae]